MTKHELDQMMATVARCRAEKPRTVESVLNAFGYDPEGESLDCLVRTVDDPRESDDIRAYAQTLLDLLNRGLVGASHKLFSLDRLRSPGDARDRCGGWC
jgi:hypothetical protein